MCFAQHFCWHREEEIKLMSKKNLFVPKPKIWVSEEPKIMKSTVRRVISGNTFETNDGRIIRLQHIETPPQNRANYIKAKKDLEEILRKNVPVKIKPMGETQTGIIIAKVQYKSGDVSKRMAKKGWGKNNLPAMKSRPNEKIRWHEKYKR